MVRKSFWLWEKSRVNCCEPGGREALEDNLMGQVAGSSDGNREESLYGMTR